MKELVFVALDEETLHEEKKKGEVSFLDHLEDVPIRDGEAGFDTVLKALDNTAKFLRGKKVEGFTISTKIDGSPALIVGTDPKTGQFFVGTKSFFSKNPKINYSEDDIKLNHPNSKGLSKKLKAALEHLPKVMPKTGVFQGDFLFDKSDLMDGGDIEGGGDGHYHFQPNTIKYSIPKDSEEGEKVGNSKMGFAPHTEYKDKGEGEMESKFSGASSKFQKHDDVYIMDTKTKGPFKFSGEEEGKIHDCIKSAKLAHKSLTKVNGYHLVKGHEPLLLAYINDAVRTKRNTDGAGYMAFAQNRMSTKAKSLKMNPKSNAIKDSMDDGMKSLAGNKEVMGYLFQIHKNITKAKNILIDALSKGTEFAHSINGAPSKAEGFVLYQDKRPIKLVDRQHFSSANMEWNQKVNPEDNPMVLSWGRMNPAHAGHEQMINRGEEIAKKSGAKHQVVATRTKDGKDNPLEPNDKLKWLKTMFPGKNIALADPDKGTITAQLQHMNHSGVKDLTLVVGQDRVKDFQKLLDKYNGDGKDKLFNFRRIRVISAGERDPKASGTKGASGTKMRDAAKKGDFGGFSKHLPKTMKVDQQKKYFGDVVKSYLKQK